MNRTYLATLFCFLLLGTSARAAGSFRSFFEPQTARHACEGLSLFARQQGHEERFAVWNRMSAQAPLLKSLSDQTGGILKGRENYVHSRLGWARGYWRGETWVEKSELTEEAVKALPDLAINSLVEPSGLVALIQLAAEASVRNSGKDFPPGFRAFEAQAKESLASLSIETRKTILKDGQIFEDPFVDLADRKPWREFIEEFIPAIQFGGLEPTGTRRNWVGHWRLEMDAVIDSVFGLDFEKAEFSDPFGPVHSELGAADWSESRLPSTHLLTSFFDLKKIFENVGLKPGDHVVDLGCAYGRAGLFLGAKYPEVNFRGLDINTNRIHVGNSLLSALNYSNARLEIADLSSSSFALPEADYYFMYNPVNEATLIKILGQLREISERRRKPITLLTREGTGLMKKVMRKQGDWLVQKERIPSKVWHWAPTTVYESKPNQ